MPTWTTPRTWTDGNLEAAALNTIRDQLINLNDRLTLLGATSDATLQPLRGALYGYRGSGTRSSPSGEEVVISMSSAEFNSHGFAPSNTFTIPVGGAGIYLVGYGVSWAGHTDGSRRARISLNGTTTHIDEATERVASAGGSVNTQVSGSGLFSMSVGEYLHLRVLQNSGSNLTVEGILWAIRVALV